MFTIVESRRSMMKARATINIANFRRESVIACDSWWADKGFETATSVDMPRRILLKSDIENLFSKLIILDTKIIDRNFVND